MLKNLKRILTGRSKWEPLETSSSALSHKDVTEEEIPRYPPFAKGLPAASIDRILETQAELIEKVRTSLGFTLADFALLVLPVIQRYAGFVHLLPASESHHHRGAGGLFRHGLEVAFWTTQASESVIFSMTGNPRERRDNEPRWRFACCLAGLLHDVGKPLSDVSVTDKEGSITWNPYFESLHAWANRHGIGRYFIRWRDKRHKRHEQFSLLAVDRIIPTEARKFLSETGPCIMEAMLEAISGTRVNQPITKLMLRADQESVCRDLRQNRLNVDEFSYGVPVERYVFDAIRRLVKIGQWKVNQPGAKVWHLHQGVFITWKPLSELYELISQDKIPSIPRDPDTLADILIERGLAIPNTVAGKGEGAYYRYWEVLPEMLREATGGIKILMLRLESNDLVFTTEPPAAVAAEVVGDVPEAMIGAIDAPVDADSRHTGESTKSTETTILQCVETTAQSSEQPPRWTAEAMPPEAGAAELTVPALEMIHTEENRPSKENAKAALVKMLASYGQVSALLEKAIIPVLEGEMTLGEVLCLIKGQAVILYPEGARILGTPSDVLSLLSSANAIVPDPLRPGCKIRDFDGIKAMVLEEKLSNAVVAAIKETEKTDDTWGGTFGVLKDFEIKAKKIIPSPNKKPDNFLNVLNGMIKNNSTESAKESMNKPVEEKQNIARMPKRVACSGKEKSDVTEDKTLLQMENEGYEEQIGGEANAVKNKIETEGILQETLSAAEVSPQKAIQILKEMMQKRSGRWLATAVLQENGYLVTSDQALDLIAMENIGISKHILCGMLSRAQRAPVLRRREGKLYLENNES